MIYTSNINIWIKNKLDSDAITLFLRKKSLFNSRLPHLKTFQVKETIISFIGNRKNRAG